jgi:site-specific recombinase XerD
MRLSAAIQEFINYKRSLGMLFRTPEDRLKAFIRQIGDVELDSITVQQVREHLYGSPGPVTRFWLAKFSVLDGFFRYAISRHYMAHSPLPTSLPKAPARLTPYLFSVDEMRRLLNAADLVYSPSCLLEPHTVRTLLLLLYGTGMRIGEAMRLTIRDVDLKGTLLTIRETKFFKSRLVPVGSDLASALQLYYHQQWDGREHTGDSPFLCTHKGTKLTLQRADRVFKQLRTEARIARTDGGRYQPRLHDIRHTFAVTRLVTWYREGKNVQRLLPHLSTYLGHAYLADTSIYLTMTKDLLQEASRCFELYALPEVQHD